MWRSAALFVQVLVVLFCLHATAFATALQPGVAELIEGTYMERPVGHPDPNEPAEVIRAYLDSADLKTFQRLALMYPDSRHARLGYAKRAEENYQKSGDSRWLQLALQEVLAAARNGFRYDRVMYAQWTRRLALEANRPEVAVQWFEEVLRKHPNHYDVTLQYAKLMQTTDLSKAEKLFLKAIKVRPEDTLDALACYAEFLLDQGRYEQALSYTVITGQDAYYLDFLHGYALEKMGRGAEAVYYYQRYVRFSRTFPAPARYKISGSLFQKGVTFEK